MLKAAWVMHLPRGLREQPAWIFIGFMVFVAGLGFVTGVTESTVARAVGPTGLRVWGALLLLSGLGVLTATWSARPALEKLALRSLAVCMLMYVGWLLTVVEWQRAAWSVILGILLAGLAEIRVATLKGLYRIAENWQDE